MPGPRGEVLAALLRTATPLTGRQLHSLLESRMSLWSVQEALKAWVRLGVVQTQTVGRATLHTVNEQHAAVAPLRALLDPIATIAAILYDVAGNDVDAIVLFGSVARRESTPESDIDLAVIAPFGWDGRADLEDTVRQQLGNTCDVLVFTPQEFQRLAEADEPVVGDILRDGVALLGDMPRSKRGAA